MWRSMITALELYVERPALSFEDCYLVSEATLEDAAPLFTFDEKLGCTSAQLVT